MITPKEYVNEMMLKMRQVNPITRHEYILIKLRLNSAIQHGIVLTTRDDPDRQHDHRVAKRKLNFYSKCVETHLSN
jgi:hypothetical protein